MLRTIIMIVFALPLFGQRYMDSTFIPIQTHVDEIYAVAPQLTNWIDENSATEVDLTMHIFQPQGDTEELRPAVLMIHGGAFIAGSKENEDMIKFCKNLAGKGYVTASMQYRLGMNAASQVSGERAVYRGIQDGRAAVRYLKENAAALKIDTANIFMLGSSAGSFIALHNLFMNEESERPAGTYAATYDIFPFTVIPDLGSYDAIEPTLNSGKGSHPKAVAALWGALQDTSLILPKDLDYPVFLIHGTDDGTVPFSVGSPFGWGGFPPTYGSSPISTHFNDLEFVHESYFVDGEDHEFYGCYNGDWSNDYPINQYWHIILDKVTEFFYDNLNDSLVSVDCKDCESDRFKLYQNYPNPFNPSTTIVYEIPAFARMTRVSLKVYDILGNEVKMLVNENQKPGYYEVKFNANSLSSGIYFYRLKTSDGIEITKKLILIK